MPPPGRWIWALCRTLAGLCRLGRAAARPNTGARNLECVGSALRLTQPTLVYGSAARAGLASFRPGRPRNMKSKHTVRVERRRGKYVEVLRDGSTRPLATGKTDWARVDAMTDEEIEAAVRSDPDARLSTPDELKRMRRIPYAKHVRWKVGLSQAEFARRFQIPIGTLRDWEALGARPGRARLPQGDRRRRPLRRARPGRGVRVSPWGLPFLFATLSLRTPRRRTP